MTAAGRRASGRRAAALALVPAVLLATPSTRILDGRRTGEKSLCHKGFSLRRCIEQVYDVGVIDGLEAVLDELGAADPQALADPEAVERLHRCLARLEAATTRASAAFDASGAWDRGPPGRA